MQLFELSRSQAFRLYRLNHRRPLNSAIVEMKPGTRTQMVTNLGNRRKAIGMRGEVIDAAQRQLRQWKASGAPNRSPESFGLKVAVLQLRSRLQRSLFESDRAMTHLHLARDVQVMAGIRLRQVPAIFRQSCERRDRKQEQCQQSALYKGREPISQM